jgi:hypothetical protein
MDLMFNNAKAFNEDISQLYKDAVRAKTHSMSGVFSPATSPSVAPTDPPPNTSTGIIVLEVLGGETVRSAESDVARLDTSGHVMGFGSYGVFIKLTSVFVKRFRVVEHQIHALNELIQALIMTTLDGFL